MGVSDELFVLALLWGVISWCSPQHLEALSPSVLSPCQLVASFHNDLFAFLSSHLRLLFVVRPSLISRPRLDGREVTGRSSRNKGAVCCAECRIYTNNINTSGEHGVLVFRLRLVVLLVFLFNLVHSDEYVVV